MSNRLSRSSYVPLLFVSALVMLVLAGCAGETGPAGTAGNAGAQGPAGPQGPQGPAGAAGKDAEVPDVMGGVTLQAGAAKKGDSINILASGLPAGPISFTAASDEGASPFGSCSSGASGACSATVTVRLDPGVYSVQAWTIDGTMIATAPLLVMAAE